MEPPPKKIKKEMMRPPKDYQKREATPSLGLRGVQGAAGVREPIRGEVEPRVSAGQELLAKDAIGGRGMEIQVSASSRPPASCQICRGASGPGDLGPTDPVGAGRGPRRGARRGAPSREAWTDQVFSWTRDDWQSNPISEETLM